MSNLFFPWSSASSSSRSSPVAIGMTSSTLVGAGLSPGEERRGEVRLNTAGAVERGAARAEDDDAAARRREGARVWRRRHMAAAAAVAAVVFSGRPSRRWSWRCRGLVRCRGRGAWAFGASVSGWPVTAPPALPQGVRRGFPLRRRYSENVLCSRSNSKQGRAIRCAPLHETPRRPLVPSSVDLVSASQDSHVTSWIHNHRPPSYIRGLK